MRLLTSRSVAKHLDTDKPFIPVHVDSLGKYKAWADLKSIVTLASACLPVPFILDD
jgi:hypothetical protein